MVSAAVMEDVRALVKIDGPVAAAKNVYGHLVAHAINAGDCASNHGCSGARHRRGIKNRIVAVCNQRAGSGGAIKNVGLGLRLRNGSCRGGGLSRAGFVDAFALFVGRFLICRSLVRSFLLSGLLTSEVGPVLEFFWSSPLAGTVWLAVSRGRWLVRRFWLIGHCRRIGRGRSRQEWSAAATAQYSGQTFAERRNRGSAWPGYSAPSRKGRTS